MNVWSVTYSTLLFSCISDSSFTPDSPLHPVCFAGAVFSRFILTGVWKNLIDVLSTPLTGRMAGSSKGLAFILGAEGIKEQSQRERDTICLSLDGLRKAAALSCALGERNMCHMCLHQQEKQDTALVPTGILCFSSLLTQRGRRSR